MSLTLSEALELDCLEDTHVIAGRLGLGREIRFVNVMEVPDIVNWVSQDGLLLTTGYAFKDQPTAFSELIIKLHEKGLTGLAIKPHRFLKELPREMIQVAEELGFPILELRPNVQFDQVIRDVLTEVINRDYQKIVKSEQIHKTFTKLVLSGGGLNEIASSLSQLCKAQVFIVDSNENVLAQSRTDHSQDSGDENTADSFIVNVYLYDQVAAYIRVCKSETMIREDMVAAERAAELVSMILLKNRAAHEVEKNYRNDFLNDLISGEIGSIEVVMQRGKFFGLNLALSYELLIIDVDSFADIFLKTLDELKAQSLLDKLYRFVSHLCLNLSSDSIVWERSDSVIVLYPTRQLNNGVQQQQKIFRLAEQVRNAIDNNIKDFTVSVGIGTFQGDIMNIKTSYLEAQTALRIGKMVWGKNGVYSYDKLGIYKLLVQFPDKHALNQYALLQLAPLVDYDARRGTNLVQTLEKLLENNISIKTTAEKMFIHPKTMIYRKQRIEELLNASLSDTESLFSVYMALKILRMDCLPLHK